MFFIFVALTALILAMYRNTQFSRVIVGAAITFFCYISVAVFIVVTFVTAFRHSVRRWWFRWLLSKQTTGINDIASENTALLDTQNITCKLREIWETENPS